MSVIVVADSIEPQVSENQAMPAPVRSSQVVRQLSRRSLMFGGALTLAACDGGGAGTVQHGLVETATPAGTVAPAPAPAPVPAATSAPAPTPTPATATASAATLASYRASRFLAQATMGATKDDIAKVQSMGNEAWIDAQMALPRAVSHWNWMLRSGYDVPANMYEDEGLDASVWRALVTEPDQLRQRVGMALSEILVVGISGLDIPWRQFAMAKYLDVLLDNAFGNFRTLLDGITTNLAMGSFLTFLDNMKANPALGTQPDENFARELMQLFTIGLHRLNMDGSRVLGSNGQPVETYTQNDVSQLARVFTGLWNEWDDYNRPATYVYTLTMRASAHEMGASSFLGTNIPAGTDGMAAIRTALDAIFAHPNVPPFISKQLIQRLVTSNPSAAYVGRVATVFADNGQGVRGDLKAVVKAILLDSEARDDGAVLSATSGKLREPAMRFIGWARACAANSASGKWTIGSTSDPMLRLGQTFGRSGSVFNFFRPGYTPPNTSVAANNMVAPEMQMVNEVTTVGFINFMKTAIESGVGDVKADYSALTALASDPAALVDEINLVLAAGQLSSATLTSIRTAVATVAAPEQRVQAALLLTIASPDYITLK